MALTDLDRKFDAVLAAVTGPGGQVVLDQDEQGRAIVANFPATLPLFFKTFCMLNADVEAIIAGDERLTFRQLDEVSDRLAQGLATRGIGKGDRVGIAMRNCPAWVLAYMAVLKTGAIATLLNGWWQSDELEHALQLTEPKLILADAPRAKRIAEACVSCAVETIDISAVAPGIYQAILTDGSGVRSSQRLAVVR